MVSVVGWILLIIEYYKYKVKKKLVIIKIVMI